MPGRKISAHDPYERTRVEVVDSHMSYLDVGSGDPVVFLHGNGTFSYVWRNIVPYVEPLGRCLAPDLMGCGRSGRIPGGSYRIADQSRYLDAWFDAMDLGGSINLVLHDWGGPLGFDWAYRHRDQVKSITYMETLVLPLTWNDWPEIRRDLFQQFRSPMGEDLVLRDNFFIETIQSRMLRNLTDEEMDTYREPYLEPGESRRPTLTFTRECPIGGEPKDVIEMINRCGDWLSKSEIPKLFINAYPGSILTGRQRKYCRTWPNQQERLVQGIHYMQEDSPHQIGDAISEFLQSIG
ncbi:MAG: haloalkane dehalogenase [Bryobacterales bacterium]|nr:haloalkane dehalogenase [Bryobacterales bacterium]